MYLLMFIVGFYALFIMVYYRGLICEAKQATRQVFLNEDVFLQRYCTDIMRTATKNSFLVVKWLRYLCFYGSILSLAFGTGLAYIFDDTSYPLPIPCYLPFLKPVDWVTYTINVAHQSIGFVCMANYYSGLVCSSLSDAIYGLAWHDCTIKLNSVAQALIDEASFAHYTKLLMFFQENLRRLFEQFVDATSGYFMVMELCCYCVLFTCGIIIKLDFILVLKGFPGFCILIGVLCVVLFNEAYIEKVSLTFYLNFFSLFELFIRLGLSLVIDSNLNQALLS